MCVPSNVPAEARARLQRCSRLTSPIIRLLRGGCQHPSPLMSRGGLSLATRAGSFDGEARAASQGYMAACNRRRVLQIRRKEFPTFLGSVGRGQWSTLTPRAEFSPTSWTAWTAWKPVSSEDGGWHRPDSCTVRTFGRNPFGPAVASPFPCAWRRPRLAVAGAGIADSKERR